MNILELPNINTKVLECIHDCLMYEQQLRKKIDKDKNETLINKLKHIKVPEGIQFLKEFLYYVHFLHLSKELKSAIAYIAWQAYILNRANTDLKGLRCVALQDAYGPNTE